MSTRPPHPETPVRRGLRFALAPLQAFFRLEAASSLLLLIAAAAALLWANSPLGPLHHALFARPFHVGRTELDLLEVIDEGLMAVFFLLVGLEIKRELAVGELKTFSAAVLPALAASGGMAVPALIYLAVTHGTGAVRGWGIPVATDIAFSLGVLKALKGRIPNSLIAFLTALAIFDDLGGILVIAFFYGHWLAWGALAISAGLIALMGLLHSARFTPVWLYVPLTVALWLSFGAAGIHPTLAGVVAGLFLPIHGRRGEPVLERWETALHPWVAYLIVPLFALANAGVSVVGLTLHDLLSPVALGVTLGLLFGKPIGISLATWLSIRFRISPVPRGSSPSQLLGVAATGGIGFTVALFIAQLAFTDHPLELEQAKLGILLGSAASAVIGYVWLRLASPASAEEMAT